MLEIFSFLVKATSIDINEQLPLIIGSNYQMKIMTIAYVNGSDSTELYAIDNLWHPFLVSSRIQINGVTYLSQSNQPMTHYENHWKTKNPSKIKITDLTTSAPEQLNVDFKVRLSYKHFSHPDNFLIIFQG